MARPRETGLRYFPLDVNTSDDQKMELFEIDAGLKGFAVYIKLLQKIYKNGYFIKWDSKIEKIFASKLIGVTHEEVTQIVNLALEHELFSEEMFERHSVLTSAGIQTRYIEASLRKTKVELFDELLLVNIKTPEWSKLKIEVVKYYKTPVSDYESKVFDYEVGVSDSRSTQTKLNKTKLNKIKSNNRKNNAVPGPSFSRFKERITSNLENIDLDFEIQYCRKEQRQVSPEDPLYAYHEQCIDFLKHQQAKAKQDYLDQLLEVFQDEYEKSRGYEYVMINRGKERKGIGKLVGIYNKKHKGNKTTGESIDDFRAMFAYCLGIKKEFFFTNMSPSFIASKYNEIKSELKNANGKHNSENDLRELAEITNDYFTSRERGENVGVFGKAVYS